MLTMIPFVLSNWRVFLVGATAIFIGAWALHERSALIHQGATQAIEQVEKRNDAEMAKANSASTTVDGCYATGGTWDRTRGVCVSATR